MTADLGRARPLIVPALIASFVLRIAVRPGSSGCLTWWTVDLFIGPDGAIRAITLDLFEP